MLPDSPIEFFDLSWLAVRPMAPEVIIAALDLSDPYPATWRQGINATAGDFWDFDAPDLAHLSRVFITPEVAGWQLVVGGWLGGSDLEDPGRDVAGYCRKLSSQSGEAHAFTTQGRMDWYSWCLARSGTIQRHFLWAECPLIDEGTPTAVELEYRHGADGSLGWQPDESAVMAIANECSVGPDQLGLLQSTGTGLLVTTAWGRKHGVPSRNLDDTDSA